jgi:hypothetical protein
MAAQQSILRKRISLIADACSIFPPQYFWGTEKSNACLTALTVALYYRQEFFRKCQANSLAGLELASQQCMI